MTDNFRTINKPSEGLYKDRASKFLAFAFPVNTEEEIKNIQKKLRKKYFDARHHCYSYRLGAEKKLFRANDDGEPPYSAGKPILGQIQSYDLTNILIVVVRYFGGTLLGVSGLINAYRSAAADAINNAKIVIKTVNSIIEIRFDYKDVHNVMKVLKLVKPDQLKQDFNLTCYIKMSIKQSSTDKLLSHLKKIESLKYIIKH